MNKLLILLFLLGCATYGQHQDKVDFTKAEVLINLEPVKKMIQGTVEYQFDVIEKVDSIFFDAKNMVITSMRLEGKKVKFKNDGKVISILKKFKKGQGYTITLEYSCTPKQTVYFLGWDDEVEENEQIWTQGQGKYTSHWLPSFDDMNEKVEFDLTIKFNKNYIVIANGVLKEKELINIEENKEMLWHFDMEKPMSSYLLAFAVGNYNKLELTSESGIPIKNFYYPQDSLKVEPTYRYAKQIFDFLEKEIGVAYPWQNYKQIPVHDFLYAGMENTSATIFSDGYVIDSTAFVDKNYINVNAHELAHQWFGDLVTEKDSKHHWLHEGFATYYAYSTEKKIFGDDHFYWKLYSSALQLESLDASDKGQALTNPKASSLVFYEKGAIALFMLKDLVGERSFKLGVKNYLEKHQFKNVTITDFIIEIEQASGLDLSSFSKQWLSNTSFPFDELKSVLKESSTSLKVLFDMENELQTNQSDDLDYEYYWNKTSSFNLKKYIIEKHYRILPITIIDSAFASNNLQIRQTLATSLYGNSAARVSNEETKIQFESLLEDKSYNTIEAALFKLWVNFPENRKNYLAKTKNLIGLPNKNVRLLWLTLAILTNDYEASKTKDYFQELNNYTAAEYGWEIRMTTFSYLKDALGLNEIALLNLMKACSHHSWQFKKFARNLLEELLKDTDYKTRVQNLAKQLKGEELRYIKIKLEK